MASQSDLGRHVEASGLSYFVLHLRLGPYFEVGYYSARKVVEHITEELTYVHHSHEVLHALDQGRLPMAMGLITTCHEVQASGDVFTDKPGFYCVKIYDYYQLDNGAEQFTFKWMAVRWITEDDIPYHLDLYPNHPPILKDDPCMGVDDSHFASYVMTEPWFLKKMCQRQRRVTRRSATLEQQSSKPCSLLAMLRQATEERKATVSRLASTRRALCSQRNLLDPNSQLAITRDLRTDFPVELPDAGPSPVDDAEWPTEFTMEPYVDLEVFIQPPNRSPSKLHVSVSRRLPDQIFFARFCSEDPSQPSSPSTRARASSEYTTSLGGRTRDLDVFLRQYTELVTDRGRYPAQVILTYAGQSPAMYKEYPYFFAGWRGDLFDPVLTQPTTPGGDDASRPLSVG